MSVTQAVLTHPYAALGPLVLLEGPAATITAGTLVGAGLASFWPIWMIVVAAEVTGDSLLYLAGRWARLPWIAALLRRTKATRLLDRLATMPLPKLVLTAKVIDVFALPAFVGAGMTRIPYPRFAAWVAAAAAVRGLVLISIGALLGTRLSGLLALPGGIYLLTATVAIPVLLLHLGIKRLSRRKVPQGCASSSAPTPTPPTSTERRTSLSASPQR